MRHWHAFWCSSRGGGDLTRLNDLLSRVSAQDAAALAVLLAGPDVAVSSERLDTALRTLEDDFANRVADHLSRAT